MNNTSSSLSKILQIKTHSFLREIISLTRDNVRRVKLGGFCPSTNEQYLTQPQIT